jgi:hypothetical protein
MESCPSMAAKPESERLWNAFSLPHNRILFFNLL